MIVLIDSSVLGILANPNKLGEAKECEEWLYKLLSKGVYVATSDLCDYEVRRGRELCNLLYRLHHDVGRADIHSRQTHINIAGGMV